MISEDDPAPQTFGGVPCILQLQGRLEASYGSWALEELNLILSVHMAYDCNWLHVLNQLSLTVAVTSQASCLGSPQEVWSIGCLPSSRSPCRSPALSTVALTTFPGLWFCLWCPDLSGGLFAVGWTPLPTSSLLVVHLSFSGLLSSTFGSLSRLRGYLHGREVWNHPSWLSAGHQSPLSSGGFPNVLCFSSRNPSWRASSSWLGCCDWRELSCWVWCVPGSALSNWGGSFAYPLIAGPGVQERATRVVLGVVVFGVVWPSAPTLDLCPWPRLPCLTLTGLCSELLVSPGLFGFNLVLRWLTSWTFLVPVLTPLHWSPLWLDLPRSPSWVCFAPEATWFALPGLLILSVPAEFGAVANDSECFAIPVMSRRRGFLLCVPRGVISEDILIDCLSGEDTAHVIGPSKGIPVQLQEENDEQVVVPIPGSVGVLLVDFPDEVLNWLREYDPNVDSPDGIMSFSSEHPFAMPVVSQLTPIA